MAPHPTTHPNTCIHVFCIQQAQKTCFITRLWVVLRFLKWMGGMSIFAILGPFWPTLGCLLTLWALPRGLLRLFSHSTTLTPCHHFWQARSEYLVEIWNTSVIHWLVLNLDFWSTHGESNDSRWIRPFFAILTKAWPTDRQTNRPTDQPTDRASYRDAWAHLKTSAHKIQFLSESRVYFWW